MSIFQLCMVFLLGVGTSFVFISPKGVSINRPENSHPVRYSAVLWGFFLHESLPMLADAGMSSDIVDVNERTGDVDAVDIFVSPKVRLATLDTVSSQTMIPFALGMLAGYFWLWLKRREMDRAALGDEKAHEEHLSLNCEDWKNTGYAILILAWVFFFGSF